MPKLSGPNFYAIDVETANRWPSSICQIGVVRVCQGRVTDTFSTLVNPEASFDFFNVRIHGIGPEVVADAPAFDEIFFELADWLGDDPILVSHTWFDRNAMNGAAQRYGLPHLTATWVDSVALARRAWPERRGGRGYNLANLAADLGITFQHHDALEDARAAAGVVLYACLESGLGMSDWVNVLSKKPTRR